MQLVVALEPLLCRATGLIYRNIYELTPFDLL
jgi:hypothetical protein